MATDLFIMSGCQQSNSGFADWNATGGLVVGAAGADFGFGINSTTSVFPQVTLWKRFSNNPPATVGGTTVYFADYQGPLKAYGAAGTTNMGHEQSLGRALIEWGIATNPFLQDEAISGSSIVTHWNKTTGWGGIYANAVTRAQAARAAAGLDPIACLHRQIETDTSTTSGNLVILADGTYYKNWYDVYFADVGVPINTPIIVPLCNSAQSGLNQDVPAGRACQLAWKAVDPRVILIDMDHLPLHANPHYDMCAQFSAGFLIAVEIAKLKGMTVRQGTGNAPFWRYDEPCFSATYDAAHTFSVPAQPRSGPDPQVGDTEVYACWAYSAVVTHVLAVSAGLTQIGTQVDSAFSGSVHKSQTLWYRVLKESDFYVDGAGKRRTNTPSFTFGVATLCIAKLVGTYKNVDPSNPINAFVFGTQTASNTSHTVPTLTTTTPGCLIVIGGSDNGTNCSNTGLTNANLTGLVQRRDGRVNPGAGQVGYWVWDGTMTGAGAIGTSAAAFSVASVPTSFALALNPAPAAPVTPPDPSADQDVVAIGSSSTQFTIVLKPRARYRLSGTAGFWFTQGSNPTATKNSAPSVYVAANKAIMLTAAAGSPGNKVAVIQDGAGTGFASLTRVNVGR